MEPPACRLLWTRIFAASLASVLTYACALEEDAPPSPKVPGSELSLEDGIKAVRQALKNPDSPFHRVPIGVEFEFLSHDMITLVADRLANNLGVAADQKAIARFRKLSEFPDFFLGKLRKLTDPIAYEVHRVDQNGNPIASYTSLGAASFHNGPFFQRTSSIGRSSLRQLDSIYILPVAVEVAMASESFLELPRPGRISGSAIVYWPSHKTIVVPEPGWTKKGFDINTLFPRFLEPESGAYVEEIQSLEDAKTWVRANLLGEATRRQVGDFHWSWFWGKEVGAVRLTSEGQVGGIGGGTIFEIATAGNVYASLANTSNQILDAIAKEQDLETVDCADPPVGLHINIGIDRSKVERIVQTVERTEAFADQLETRFPIQQNREGFAERYAKDEMNLLRAHRSSGIHKLLEVTQGKKKALEDRMVNITGATNFPEGQSVIEFRRFNGVSGRNEASYVEDAVLSSLFLTYADCLTNPTGCLDAF